MLGWLEQLSTSLAKVYGPRSEEWADDLLERIGDEWQGPRWLIEALFVVNDDAIARAGAGGGSAVMLTIACLDEILKSIDFDKNKVTIATLCLRLRELGERLTRLVLRWGQKNSSDHLIRIALTTAYGKPLAYQVLSAMRSAGPDGQIEVIDLADEGECRVEVMCCHATAFPLSSGSLADVDELESPHYLICDRLEGEQIEVAADLLPSKKTPLVCISPSIMITAYSAIATTVPNATIINLVDVENATDIMEDIAVMTDGRRLAGGDLPSATDLGSSRTISKMREYLLVGGGASSVAARKSHVDHLQEIHENTELEDLQNHIQDRQSRIIAPLVELHVRGADQAAREFLVYLTWRTVFALRGCLESGWISGAGIAYARCADHLESKHPGDAQIRAIATALRRPLRCLYEGSDAGFEEFLAFVSADKHKTFDAEKQRLIDANLGGPLDASFVCAAVVDCALTGAANILQHAEFNG
jgi:hypothetical protein